MNIRTGEQFAPEFLKISPNNRMPAIVDHEGPGGKPISLFESGAILLYLAEKTGKFLPTETPRSLRSVPVADVPDGGCGSDVRPGGHVRAAPEKIRTPSSASRTKRRLSTSSRAARERPILAGDYSIADIATCPWVVGIRRESEELASRPNLKRWLDAISERPAVKRGVAVMADLPPQPLDDAARSILYGAKQFERR